MIDTQKSNFQYTTPKISKFNYSADLSFSDKELEIKMQHNKSIVRNSKNDAYVELNMRIFSNEEISPFEIECTVCANFRWENMTEDIINTLLNQTAPSLLCGYVRPIIAMFTNSSGFMPFNMPLINFKNEPFIDTKYIEK